VEKVMRGRLMRHLLTKANRGLIPKGTCFALLKFLGVHGGWPLLYSVLKKAPHMQAEI